MSLLVAREIVAGYVPGIDILRGCSIEVREGELVGLVGPNGAGKSTLVKCIFGLVPIRSGSVHLGGEDVTTMAGHELAGRGVGYVPQRDNVFPSLTVADNLRMGAYLQPRFHDERASLVTELFPRLSDRLHQRAGSLSGGERQMLGMARALMTEPRLLLLDEPSAGLSPAVQDEVFDRIQLIGSTGVSVLMVEQNARRCLQIVHRGYVLDQGVEAHEGTGAELLDDPRVVELYLGTLRRTR